MSDWLAAILTVAAIMVYTAVAGGVGVGFFRNRCAAHNNCRNNCSWDHASPAFFAGLCWPFTLPLVAGMAFGDRTHRREVRADRLAKRIKELERDVFRDGR